ncbi:MAG: hypothetical protein KGL58_04300, partial [Pseudomonadota bacterium]|nr:hypothetical protein [Pseudomonadota bacterium]
MPRPFVACLDLPFLASLLAELPVSQALDLLDLDVHPWIVARPELFKLTLKSLAQGKKGRLEEIVLEDMEGDDMLFFVASALHHYQ